MAYKSPVTHLPDEHMRLVGIIAAHWEMFLVLLTKAVCEWMKLKPDDVRLLTVNLSTQALFDLMAVPAKLLDEADKKSVHKAVKRMQKAYALRNRFVHARWAENTKNPKQPTLFGVRTRGGKLKIEDAPVDISELEAAADEIIDATENFVRTLQRLGLLKNI